MADSPFNSIPEAIEDIRNGEIIIVVDDEDRENEGDFLMAADKASPEAINVMVKHGRGLVCVPITKERAREMELDYMVTEGADPDEAAFTISVDHKKLTTTGISAPDRANTIQELINPEASPSDFRRPGHIFPLIGVNGGVLRRAGHTEAAIDFARLAGCQPAGVICEIMHDDGEMARLPELIELSKRFDMKLVTIKDLIAYRMENESLVKQILSVDMPTIYGHFQLQVFEEKLTGEHHLAFTKGEWSTDDSVLVRVHSANPLADIFGSKRSDKTAVLQQSLKMVETSGCGVVLYMDQMSNEYSIIDQIAAIRMQDEGMSKEEIRKALGSKMDARDYGVGAQILHQLGVRKLRLLTNNPVKRVGLKSFGLEMVEEVEIPLDHIDTEHHEEKLDKPETTEGFLKKMMLE
ncbi:MAG: 3,4-dihydroxy-2-butanone-4-phosphate synthase [Bacteroidetes bacterium]|jgi:3,4-dihydroxy 2-butanone 4-phosphate synthase/GTP cyclohydrolase II|nr:3,4-dihydroxy-2-butanone-4-phosphate synthase [Bacteroidota bacterium]